MNSWLTESSGAITGIELRFTAKPIEPRRLTLRAPPSIGHEVPCDPEDVAAQFFVVQCPDIRAQQPTERILHDVVGVARVTNHAVDVRPQRARRALVEPRKLDFGQRSTYTDRATSFVAWECDWPLISPILRDSLNDT